MDMEHTLISTINIEKKGKKAFFKDGYDTDQEIDAQMDFPWRFKSMLQQTPRATNEIEDIQYMGGQKEKNGKSSGTAGGTPGLFEKIMSSGGNNTSNP